MTLSPEVKARQKVERRIVRRVVSDLIRAGYALNVYNGGDEHELPQASRKVREVLGAMFATDDEYLIVFRAEDLKHGMGWVRFIYGNSGWDVLADNTTNLEEILKPAGELADKLSE